MPADNNSRRVSTLKKEHEHFREQVGNVDKALGGIDELLAVAPREKLGELRDRLFTLHDALVYLKGAVASHQAKETTLLLERQTPRNARALKSQHDEILQATEQAIKAIGEALPENASREQLREASVIVQNIFYGIIGMVMKHMSGEDALIDLMAGKGQLRS